MRHQYHWWPSIINIVFVSVVLLFIASSFLAVPVFAATDNACVKTALTKREDALLAEFDKVTSAVKSARQTRKAELLAAWDIQETKARKTAVQSAWSKYSTAAKGAWATWRTNRNTIWSTYKNERSSCGIAIDRIILTPAKTQVKPGEVFDVRWEVQKGTVTAKDWITMASPASRPDQSWLGSAQDVKEFFYTDGRVSGTKNLKATSTPGTYVLRYFENDTFKLKTQGTTTITVAP